MSGLDLTGVKFGKLTAIEKAQTEKKGTYWKCLCECGNYKDVFIGHLRSSKIKSCGCYKPHHTHGKSKTPEHISWCAMRNRCLKPNTNGYKHYGGKGIKICKRWDSFELFLQDMGKRPNINYSLDRIDPRGNYEPSNCRWSDRKTQARNQTNAQKWIVFGKEYETADEAGEAHNVSGTTIRSWCDGWRSKITDHYTPPKEGCKRYFVNG